ncbi:MAG TPA: ribonuclease H-like domain-containing protein [Candidatus Nanoarchaeia archaeon]|nr:ribonuclease H-like domain-containing protein [Candidatus Nanoarchaeia archaeon]
MIEHSFVFLEKITTTKEKSLWARGITDWQRFLKITEIRGIPSLKKFYYNRQIELAQQALRQGDSSYFVGKLAPKYMWRLYDSFKDECGFLDIEIDSHGKVVVVGISNYYSTNFFVKGANLEKSILEKELKRYKLLVTFNGASFDLPRLRKQCGISITIPHIDLKPLCVKWGMKGGLKEIEKQLNLKRPTHLYGNPVELWKAFHASGDREYLELLLDYNREDVENLKAVMEKVYQRLKFFP